MTTPAGLLTELLGHPHLDELASKVDTVASAAHAGRNTRFLRPDAPDSTDLASADIAPEHAETAYGNVLEVLRNGATSAPQRRMIAMLVLLGARKALDDAGSRDALAARLLWLAAHTPCDALTEADSVLSSRADKLWHGLSAVLDAADAHGLSRSDVLLGIAILRASSSAVARELAHELATRSIDPLLKSTAPAPEEPHRLAGELVPAQPGKVGTALLGLSGLLLLRHATRALGRFAFGYRRPASVELTDRGLELGWRSELLGRRLREAELVVPLTNLAAVKREVRFSRVGLYAGLGALVVGSYFGLGLFVDGLRVPGTSPLLLGLGTLLILLGFALDFALSSLSDRARGTCRIVVIPRRGARICIGALELRQADSMLRHVADRLRSVAPEQRSTPDRLPKEASPAPS